jgi:hypothetical protein
MYAISEVNFVCHFFLLIFHVQFSVEEQQQENLGLPVAAAEMFLQLLNIQLTQIYIRFPPDNLNIGIKALLFLVSFFPINDAQYSSLWLFTRHLRC